MSKKEVVSEVAAEVISAGATFLVGYVLGPMVKTIPNPITKVFGYVGIYGLSILVKNTVRSAAKKDIDDVLEAF